MSDNKKYYYLKIAENFFERDEMIMLESMPDGYMYSNILLKLYLRSLKNEGKLLFNNRIPYNPQMLSNITRMPVAVVEKALSLFKELDLIEILDNGAIYMTDIQNFIGQSSTEADRKRNYRAKIEKEKNQIGQMSGQMSIECPDKTPPEIELEIELEIEKEIDIEIDNVSKDTSVNKFTPIIDMKEYIFNSILKKRFLYVENIATGELKQYRSYKEISEDIGITLCRVGSYVSNGCLFNNTYLFMTSGKIRV
nr:phage replisome organizer N-terminal domain-containing protein [Clostridioides sp.]